MRMRSALRALGAYLSDWKNLLSHSLVGIALVAIPLALPISPKGRLAVFFVIVGLNVLRMRWDKKRKARKAAS